LLIVTLIAAFASLVLLAAAHGVFFAYSNSVVPGLDRADARTAVAAMRGMNVAIVNPRFLTAFVGPVVTAALAGFLLLGRGERMPGLLFLAAAVVHLVGCLVVTGRVNVPLNNALENSADTDWARRWTEFSPRWRRWNTLRTAASGVALVLCGVGLYSWGG
jgi:uncharacterized membrane protein